MLSVNGLTKRYRDRTVLDQLQLAVGSGEYIAIVGESGSGKSTLLNLIAGLDRPDSGSVVIDGVDIAALDDTGRTLARRTRLGFVFQAFHVLPHLTVEQNVALPLVLLGVAPGPREARAAAFWISVNVGAAVTKNTSTVPGPRPSLLPRGLRCC
jgi:putative ABC transport system ATP-binding protein